MTTFFENWLPIHRGTADFFHQLTTYSKFTAKTVNQWAEFYFLNYFVALMPTLVHCRGENHTYQTDTINLCIYFNVHPKVTVSLVARLGTSFNPPRRYPQIKVGNKVSSLKLAINTLEPCQFGVILVF